MTCNSCVAKVKSELLKLGDVLSADVQLQSPQAVIAMNKHVSTETLQQAVTKAGHYSIKMQEHASNATTDAEEKKAGYKPINLYYLYSALYWVSLLLPLYKKAAGTALHG